MTGSKMDSFAGAKISEVRQLLDRVGDPIENVIDAHGFTFSAFSTETNTILLRFLLNRPEPDANWVMSLRLTVQGDSCVCLQRGGTAAPSVRLVLAVDGAGLPSLAAGLAIAFDVFGRIEPG